MPNPPLPALHIAIAQPPMHWRGEDNTAAIVRLLAEAAADGAQLCVFPELALTGFHRQIAREAQPEAVAGWLAQVQAACARHGIAAVLGAPTFAGEGRILNSLLFIDEQGRHVGTVDKRGLTDPEATFFARGAQRPVLRLHGVRCTGVICREIEDHDEVCADLAGHAPELVFWPGLMNPEDGQEHIDPPQHVQQAQQLAQRLGAYVVQSNWPESLNYPEQGAKTGRSAVISPAGELMFRLPQAAAGLGRFRLGEASHAWHAHAL